MSAATLKWNNTTVANIGERDMTASIETARRHALKEHAKHLSAVHSLEAKLNVTVRWIAGSAVWEDAAKKVKMRTYQRCIDTLEGLVVARMFELTKMNMSQTGELYILL